MSLFTDLMKSAPSNAQGHKNLEAIQAAYEKLDLDGRHAFLDEARKYIKEHKLEAKIAHPRFDAAVFVYQAAVMAEVKDIENARHDQKETSPEAIAERKGIMESPTYKSFMAFKSKLDNHEHPDGLYGPVTHALRYDMKVEQMLEQIIQTNDKAREKPVEKPAPVIEKKEEQVVVTTEKKEEKQETPAVVTDKKKPEPNLYLKNTQSFGNGPHDYTGALADTANKDPIFSSHSAAKERVSNTEAGIMTTKETKLGNLVLNAGLGLRTSNVTAADNNVNVSKLTGLDGAGQPIHTQENGTSTGKPSVLAKTSFLNVNGGAELNIPIVKDNKNVPNFVVGAHAGVGLMNSTVSNDFITGAGINTGGALNNNPLPNGSHRSELGGSISGVIGTSETHILPSVQLNAGLLKSKSVETTTLGLNLRKTFDIGKDGIQIFGQVGADAISSRIQHNSNSTITTTTQLPTNPNLPDQGSVTTTQNVSGFNGSNVNSTMHLSGTLGVNLPMSAIFHKGASSSSKAPATNTSTSLSYDDLKKQKDADALPKLDAKGEQESGFSLKPLETPKVEKTAGKNGPAR